MRRHRRLVPLVLVALLVSSCASTTPLVRATTAEHIAVVSVHAAIQAEKATYDASAYSIDPVTNRAKHQTYVAALIKIVQAEKVLNDALMTWNALSGEPMPAVVREAVHGLGSILADIRPLVQGNATLAALAEDIGAAVGALGGTP